MSAVTCSVCPHSCHLESDEVGICRARRQEDGRIVSFNYGRSTALALDPIEKKPLACYHPGSMILSYGSFGCNLSCVFCQNWEIAQAGKGNNRAKDPYVTSPLEIKRAIPLPQSRYISPEELVEQALALKPKGNIGIALTYNEPLICPEYILDVAELAHARDLKLVLVTNGYVMPTVAEQIFAVVDAANIDLKAFDQGFYTTMGAPGGLATIKRTIQIAKTAGCHVEITTLVIPGLNDNTKEMDREAAWLALLDPDIPLHLSRFHPAYQMMDLPPTPRSTINDLEHIARKYLTHVYAGNRQSTT